MRGVLQAIFALFLLVNVTLASKQCNNHTRGKRRAWHTLTRVEKKSYIDAELCLMKKPTIIGIPGAKNRFEELQATHQVQTHETHHVGAFLPFHRAFIAAHEEALRKECGYKGRQPYWAEELDAANFSASVIFDAKTGFGGDGSGPSRCITDGPFKDFVNHIGPGYNLTEHCIYRQINVTDGMSSSQKELDLCLGKSDWISAWLCLETYPHRGGHGGVNGLMRDPIASPGDPIFYLHHTWLDKAWADWQLRNLPKRLTEMGGHNILNETDWPTFPKRPLGVPVPTGADGDPGLETTLNHVLNLYGNGVNRTIGEVMDIWNGTLCYEYQPY